MARRVEVVLVDDLDGAEASETVSFALDGRAYEIDLSESNASDLRAALTSYVEAGRKVAGGGSAKRPRGARTRASRP